MAGVLCSMVGASFVTVAAEVIRLKKGIQAVGNAQIDTAQSKFGGSSALFDGSGDALTVNPFSAFAFGTGDFTIECFVRFTATPTTFVNLVDFRAGSETAPVLYMDSAKVAYGSGQTARITTTTNLNANTWYHIAVARSGTSTKLFVDGTQVGSTFTDTLNYTVSNVVIANSSAYGTGINGHIDEIRISNIARYTSNFTPSTTPFVNDANTLLLMHCDGTDATTFFEDDNGQRTQRSIIAMGNAQVDTAQSKFGGSSALFDGTGDYLIVSNTPNMQPGTGDFTWEAWVRLPNNTADVKLFGGLNNGDLDIRRISDGTLRIGKFFQTWDTVSSVMSIANTWTHLAISRSGTSCKIFKDGVDITASGGTNSINYVITTDVHIGSHPGQSIDLNGHLDEIRFSNNARYTTGFTAPTEPFVNDANTRVLIHCDGTDASTVFRDDNGTTGTNWTARSAKTLTVTGNAQVDTAQFKFGSSSILFDGTGDSLRVSPTTDFAFGTKDFTVEFWVRWSSLSGNQNIYDTRPAGTNGAYLTIGFYNNNTLYLYINDGIRISGSVTVSTNTWYHLAVSRSGTSTRMFFDGTQVGSTYTDSTSYLASVVSFGDSSASAGGSNGFPGWLDEIRVSSSARYTGSFTPSTSAFTNDVNTMLLVHAEGTDASTTFTDDNGTGRIQKGIQAFGNAQIDNAQSKFGGTSALFDGDVDYLTTDATGSLTFGTNDLTFEMWVRPIARTRGFPVIFGNESGSGFTSNSYILMDRHNSYNTKFTFWAFNHSSGSPLLTSSTSVSNGTWYHIAVVRNGSSWKMYINGTEESSATFSGSLDTSGRNLIFGVSGNLAIDTSYHGYLDEIRISNTARYTANFTAPTTPFQNDSNTLLLLHCDGTDGSTVFIDDTGVSPTHQYS